MTALGPLNGTEPAIRHANQRIVAFSSATPPDRRTRFRCGPVHPIPRRDGGIRDLGFLAGRPQRFANDLSSITLTIVYAVYAIGVVASLLLAGLLVARLLTGVALQYLSPRMTLLIFAAAVALGILAARAAPGPAPDALNPPACQPRVRALTVAPVHLPAPGHPGAGATST